MPAQFSPTVKKAALAHAMEAFPLEAAGIVEGGEYVALANRSADAANEIGLAEEDLLRVAGAELFFHSHPNGIGCPSEHDMIYQAQLEIPFVIATLPHLDVFAFGDQLGRQPLEGRGFRHGVHDCFSLIRDWYAEVKGIDHPDKPRDWHWWTKGQSHYLDHFAEWGFHEIPLDRSFEAGDVLLFKFNYEVPMHAAVVIDRDLLMHHACGFLPVDHTRLSVKVPRLRYSRHICNALRRNA